MKELIVFLIISYFGFSSVRSIPIAGGSKIHIFFISLYSLIICITWPEIYFQTIILACTAAEDFSGLSSDCTKYLRCIYGTFYALSCPSGTNFDYIKKACDLPGYAKCAVATTTTTTARPSMSIKILLILRFCS